MSSRLHSTPLLQHLRWHQGSTLQGAAVWPLPIWCKQCTQDTGSNQEEISKGITGKNCGHFSTGKKHSPLKLNTSIWEKCQFYFSPHNRKIIAVENVIFDFQHFQPNLLTQRLSFSYVSGSVGATGDFSRATWLKQGQWQGASEDRWQCAVI